MNDLSEEKIKIALEAFLLIDIVDIITQEQFDYLKKALQGLLKLYGEEKEKNIKAIEMLQEHIKHCEQEAKGSLNNEICHIALKFDKHLLQELLEEE